MIIDVWQHNKPYADRFVNFNKQTAAGRACAADCGGKKEAVGLPFSRNKPPMACRRHERRKKSVPPSVLVHCAGNLWHKNAWLDA